MDIPDVVITVYVGIMLAALLASRFGLLWRVIESAAILPISALGTYAMLLSLSDVAADHAKPAALFTIHAGFAGIVALWTALFSSAESYARAPRFALAVASGLLLGCGVAVSYFVQAFGSGVREVVTNPATCLVLAPLLTGLRHSYLIWRALQPRPRVALKAHAVE